MSDERTSYRFRRLDTGEGVEVVMTFAELIDRLDILGRITLDDGTELQRVYDHTERPRGAASGTDPWKNHYSEAAAVDPRDARAAEEHARRHGVPTSFDSEGRPHFTSGRHQARYLRLIGFHNKDGVH